MNDTRVLLYFAGFEEGSTEEGFTGLFSRFGNITKLFIHKVKNYGMVEFDNNRSCVEAIEALHQKPPLNLYVNMAKNQINSKEFNGNSSFQSRRSSQNFNNSFKQPHKKNYGGENYNMDDNISYDIEEYYMDENNEFVTVFTDPNTNEIYVPLRYAPSLRKFTRKIPKLTDMDDERLSYKSDYSDRKVKMSIASDDSVQSFTIQRNVEVDHPSNNKTFFNHVNQGFDNKKHEKQPYSNNLFQKSYDKKNSPPTKWNGENKNTHVQKSVFNPSTSAIAAAAKPKTQIHSFLKNPVQQQTTKTFPKDIQASSSSVNTEKIVPTNIQTPSVNVVKTLPKKTQIFSENNPIKSTVLKTIELPKDHFTEVHVENVVNDTIGWVTLTNKTAEFEKVIFEIWDSATTAQTTIPETGKLVLALYEEMWFRAVILTTSPTIKVRYIDYGNEEIINKTDIKEITSALAVIPAYAVCIKLANGAPCKMENDKKMFIKPINEESNVIVVHVQNGFYEEKTVVVKPPAKEHLLDSFHKLLISQIDIQNVGFLEMTIELSKTKYIAAFMPLHLTEDAAKLQNMEPAVASPSFKPSVGDIVCAQNDEGWQRVYVLQIVNNLYKVAFIDFGVIKDVSEVRSLPNEFKNIPIFSCVCTSKSDEDLSQLTDAVDFEITNVSGDNISCTIKFDDQLIGEVLCVPWDPRKHLPVTAKANLIKPCAASKTEDQIKSGVASKPNLISTLKEIVLNNGENIKLEMENDGILYVRNKQAAEIRKKIDKFMAENGPRAKTISEKPCIGQLVTAEFEGDYYRAIVKSINNNNVTICYVDYGNEEIQPFFSLRLLNEEMMKEPISIIKIRLQNFINKPFNIKALKYLENLSVNQTILKATYDKSPENGFQLRTTDGLNISDELEKLEECATMPQSIRKPKQQNEFCKTIKIPSDNEPKIFMTTLPLQEIPLGETEIVFQQFSDIDNTILCVCINDPIILHSVHVELHKQIAEYVKNVVPHTQYKPEVEECVLVQTNGKWYRGACTAEPENDNYTIFLVDYGSSDDVPATNIRRMPKEFATQNALCNFATLHGLPTNISQKLCNRLKVLLERNNSYVVNVLEKNEEDECYIISFPTIVEQLKKDGLI